ncbi:MAG: glycoside hydrolase family 9 protein [Anaerolineae bacterium]|nr:glycoside hydrolase family 9 protein [Anaerolineae bacterium]
MSTTRNVLLLILLALLSFSSVIAQDAATLIDDFDADYGDGGFTSQWWTYSDDAGSTFSAALDTETVFNGSASLRLETELVAEGYSGIGFDYGFPHDWQAGQGIIFQMRASEVGLPLNIVLHLADSTQTSSASPGVTPFGCTFTTPEGSVEDWVTVTLEWGCFQRLMWVGEEGIMEFFANPVIGFEIAFDDPTAPGGTFWFDDLRVISDTNLNQPPDAGDLFSDLPVVRASQIGYRPQDHKLFVATVPVGTFTVVDDTTGEVVYEGQGETWGLDTDTQQEISWGRFDSLETPGTYHIVLDTGDVSYPFTIAENIYAEPLNLAARALYLNRSGIAINDSAISGINLEAGHLEPAILWGDTTNTPIDVSGGWYDAGDFGRYIPTAAFAVGQMLVGFNANPEFFADGALNIPESGNSQPDLLDEIRWELDWLLKMQREDGAVHHKVTTRSLPYYGALPAEDTSQLYVFEVSSADTAYFAAAMAQAARVYASYDAAYAETLLNAAQRAWAWLEQHPEQVPEGGFQNPPVSEYPMQGGYDFVGTEDVPRMWAAAELFNTTGDAAYEAAFAAYFAAVSPERNQAMSWANAYPIALFAYLTANNADETTWSSVAEVFQAQAQQILDVSLMSGYAVALNDSVGGFEYVWGSNQVALAHGLYLMMANELFPDERFIHAALQQVQYVMGVNPLAKMYISGIGSDPMLHPHHNVSYHNQQAVPGFVTEGANSQNTGGDAALEMLWEIGVPPALRYTDNWESWASNEPTIDANATFIALLAHWAQR